MHDTNNEPLKSEIFRPSSELSQRWRSTKSELWKLGRILWNLREYGESERTIRAQSRDFDWRPLHNSNEIENCTSHRPFSLFHVIVSQKQRQRPKNHRPTSQKREASTPFVSNLIIVVLTIVTYNYFLIRPTINHLRFECCWDVEMFRLFQYNKCTFKFYNWKKRV